jgi:hypothetical protein
LSDRDKKICIAVSSDIQDAIKMWLKKQSVFAFLLILSPSMVLSWTFGHKGLVSGWMVGNLQKSSKPQLGLRYIPEFSLALHPSPSITLDSELSVNAFGTAVFEEIDSIRTDGDLKPYRLWLRFSSAQFEARIGLQKINFGSAALLRPLMWFDSLDPRDPLQLTDGVYGMLLRYYFVNNTNVWLWGLYGNEKTKGWETFPTKKNSLEYGGRLQIPLFTGEVAWTYHHRQADIEFTSLPVTTAAPEDRYGLDGKWDIGIGLWFEAALVHQRHEMIIFPWQRAVNAGLDYTFGVGNGLYVMGEHFNLAYTKNAFGSGNDIDISALLVRYPLGLLDEITGIFYYDWENEEFYRFISWQRTYDRWRFNVIGFWNPEVFLVYPATPGKNPFSGKGFQVMIIFNY